ncbi:MAG: Rrf2 family transcriptional regulator, partial [Terriglobia bacterium]
MRLTTFTDFGLRALMRLAGEPDRPFSTGEIAAEFG